MQLIVLSALVPVPYPGHTYLFFQGCMLFAKMDILQGEEFYRSNFAFVYTDPYTNSFEQFGYETMNFLINSGSALLILVCIIIYFICRWLVNKVCVLFAKFKVARKIGIFVYDKKPM